MRLTSFKLVMVLMMFNGALMQAQEDTNATIDQQDIPEAVKPQPREDQWWQDRHAEKLAKKDSMDHVDLLLVGDSITHSWENGGKEVWAQHFSEYQTLNLGYSGDRTEHVLWRLHNNEVEGISPKVAVVMIGTNNTGHRADKPKDIALGIKMILEELNTRLPDTKVLLLGIFPRDAKPDGKGRTINDATNELIKDFADNQKVWYLNINDKFLEEDGVLPKSIMPDALHPNKKGYEIWATEMKESIEKLMDSSDKTSDK